MALSVRGARGDLEKGPAPAAGYIQKNLLIIKKGAGTISPRTRIGDPQALP